MKRIAAVVGVLLVVVIGGVAIDHLAGSNVVVSTALGRMHGDDLEKWEDYSTRFLLCGGPVVDKTDERIEESQEACQKDEEIPDAVIFVSGLVAKDPCLKVEVLDVASITDGMKVEDYPTMWVPLRTEVKRFVDYLEAGEHPEADTLADSLDGARAC